jgi:hypothetical protein
LNLQWNDVEYGFFEKGQTPGAGGVGRNLIHTEDLFRGVSGFLGYGHLLID